MTANGNQNMKNYFAQQLVNSVATNGQKWPGVMPSPMDPYLVRI
jgi:hypothetical protein